MDIPTKVRIKHGLEKMPKAMPLAVLLVEEATRQRATLGEFKLAVDIAITILTEQMDPDLLFMNCFKSEIEAAFEEVGQIR